MPTVEQIKQLLLLEQEANDSDPEDDDGEYLREAIRGKASKAAAMLQRGQHNPASTRSRRKEHNIEQMESRFRFLKKVYGEAALVFDDGKPDPGCAVEALQYRKLCDPIVVPPELKDCKVWTDYTNTKYTKQP